MRFATARLNQLVIFFLLSIFILYLPVSSVFAQVTPTSTPTPTSSIPNPNTVKWDFDPEVTVVGKGSDRARQLIWWVFSHPGIHSASVFAELWGFSRNVVYVFIILVIIAFGLGLILSQRKSPLGPVFSGIASPVLGVNITTVIFRVAILLLYATFSYVIVLALIQTSDVIMKFFIENVGGKDLFNIIFSGSGNSEANYTSFIGFRDTNPLNLEMVRTSLLLIRFTSFTYYIMAIVVIIRTIILWFLLILSPFLAILMPFVFIRNIGWIWIGVFFQWLFYGPLFALFLAGLTRIWVSGIPFPFDFSRVNQPHGQVYRTSINILYGGPAQTLSPGNSANYVDTFAEYFISLIMLWAAMILPWLLLRIFRDYCCEAIAASNATLTGIFDRLRQYPPPPPPTIAPSPATQTGIAAELPFRQKVQEKEITRTKLEEIKDISKTETVEIAKSIDVSVTSLRDVSRMEMNEFKRTEVETQLNKIAAPERISDSTERQYYQMIKNELQERASRGDFAAQTLLAAAETKKEELVKQVTLISLSQPKFAPTPEVVISTYQLKEVLSQPTTISEIAATTGIAEENVKVALTSLSTMNVVNTQTIKATAQATGMSETNIQKIVNAAQISYAPKTAGQVNNVMIISQPTLLQKIAHQSNVSEEKVREILQFLPTISPPSVKQTTEIAQKTGVSESKVKEVVAISQSVISQKAGVSVTPTVDISQISSSVVISQPTLLQKIAHQSNVSEEKVREILQFLPTINLPSEKIMDEVVQKTGVKEEKIKEVIAVTQSVVAPVLEKKQAKAVSVEMAGRKVTTQVAIEDYEEVKKMWLKHYREAPVPVSEKIKTRKDWVENEEKRLTNISNLLSSENPNIRHEGLEKVAEILPFMLLGGFSDAEVLSYIQAKKEAASQIHEESELVEKAKKEAKEEIKEEEETLLEVTPKKETAPKTGVLKEERKMEIPIKTDSSGNVTGQSPKVDKQ